MDEHEIWEEFLSRPIGCSLPLRLRWMVRSRRPLHYRGPTVSLYEGLALLHQGIISQEELERHVDANEAACRSLTRKIDKAWQRFLERDAAKALTPNLLERVRSREPLPQWPPTLALYECLAAYHLGLLSLDDLEETINLNEEADHALKAAAHRRSKRQGLRLVQ